MPRLCARLTPWRITELAVTWEKTDLVGFGRKIRSLWRELKVLNTFEVARHL